MGHLAATQQLNLALTLALPNQAALQAFVERLSDPTSADYHNFLSAEQFTLQFGPTASDYQKVVDFATSYGLTVTGTSANRLVLDVSGSVSNIEKAFGIALQTYAHPTENRVYYAPNIEPSVDAGVPVQGVNGLNSFNPPRPVGMTKTVPALKVSETTGSGPGGQFLGSDMRAAYAPGVSLDGAGQALGLFEYGPYNISDVNSYFSTIGQTLKVPITNVLLDGVNGICGVGCDDGEEVIDIEQGISMAPNLAAVVVYEGNDDTDILNRMATDNVAKQLSCSFGWLPADPASDEPIFLEFAAQGQSFFVASGDGGAYSPPSCTVNCNVMFYPADDPYITAAGGTDLATQSAGGPWKNEAGWVGSGGGASTNGFAIPKYQVPVITATNHGSTTLRNIPDLAMEANTDNYYCANGSCQGGVGGTSLSAPRWAGFLALANQQSNGGRIGFVNSIIYSLGQKAAYPTDFHDITVGNNFNGDSPDLYQAVKGYDLVTGWGSPVGQPLLNVFGPPTTGPNFTLMASPSIVGLLEGGSAKSIITLTPLDGFAGTVDLAALLLGQSGAIATQISPSTLTGSGTATLTLTATATTPGGNFPVAVTGSSAGLTHTAYVYAAVPGFTLQAPSDVFVNQNGTSSYTVTVTSVNGFKQPVNLSITGVPKGVTATITTGANGVDQLMLTAGTFATAGYADLTLTGTSGNLTQQATLNLAVSAALGGAGAGTQADLSSAFNLNGIYSDGTVYTTSGLDGDGYSYSANLLKAARSLYQIPYTFGPPNQPDAVSGAGQVIALPSGKFSKMTMLGTGVNGDQNAQTIVVTYTDGTTSTFLQSFSDWYVPAVNPGEFEAVAMPYRDASNGTEDNRTFNLYGYSFNLNSAKTVQSFTLPVNVSVVVLAVTLEP